MDEHLNTINEEDLTIRQTVDAFLFVYSESTFDEIEELEKKVDEHDMELTEDEENLLYFKGHLDEYFETNFEKKVTKDKVREMIQNNTILVYLEQKMNEEEQNFNDNEFDDMPLDENMEGQFDEDMGE